MIRIETRTAGQRPNAGTADRQWSLARKNEVRRLILMCDAFLDDGATRCPNTLSTTAGTAELARAEAREAGWVWRERSPRGVDYCRGHTTS